MGKKGQKGKASGGDRQAVVLRKDSSSAHAPRRVHQRLAPLQLTPGTLHPFSETSAGADVARGVDSMFHFFFFSFFHNYSFFVHIVNINVSFFCNIPDERDPLSPSSCLLFFSRFFRNRFLFSFLFYQPRRS